MTGRIKTYMQLIPIYKMGDKIHAQIIAHFSIAIVCKVMEHTVVSYIMQHFTSQTL